MPRSCSAIEIACLQHRHPRAPPSRAHRSPVASAPRPARSSGFESIPRRWSRASRSSAPISGRMSRNSARRRHGSASPGSAAPASSKPWPRCILTGILQSDGTIDGAKAAQSGRVTPDGRTFSYLIHAGEPEIRILQTDVRAIQLAKAALYAGARLLMDHLGVDQVDRIRLAGAFGSHIDVKYAMVLGLIPDCKLCPCERRRQCRRYRRPNRPAEPRRAERDRARGQTDRKNRDRARAALSGTLRRCHGDPAPRRALPQPRRSGRLAQTDGNRSSGATTPAATLRLSGPTPDAAPGEKLRQVASARPIGQTVAIGLAGSVRSMPSATSRRACP